MGEWRKVAKVPGTGNDLISDTTVEALNDVITPGGNPVCPSCGRWGCCGAATTRATTPDDLIKEMWKVCLDQDDESTVDISAHHDMWWGVFAKCSHGNYHGYSNGTNDLSNGFIRLHKAFMEGHGHGV